MGQETPHHGPSEPASRPLLGSEHGTPGGMRQYVVNLAEQEAGPGVRAAAVDAGTATASDFVRRAKAALADHVLTDEVAYFGEAYGLPIVTFTGTPDAAKLIGSLPGVLSIYADDGGSLGVIR